MTLDLMVFEEARKIFFELERQTSRAESGHVELPDNAGQHLVTAGLAYSLITSRGSDRLRELS